MGDEVCPVCLIGPSESSSNDAPAPVFCRAECSHVFCQPCAERILVAKPPSDRLIQDDDDDFAEAMLQLPTMGRCPICRQSMNLLDIRRVDNGESIYETSEDVSAWPICNNSFQQQQPSSADNFASIFRGNGLIFRFSEDGPEVHFQNEASQPSDDRATSILPKSKVFDSFHFATKFLIFQGSMTFEDDDSDDRTTETFRGTMDCLLQFSQDCSFIRDGYVQWNPEASPEYPLDGAWRVTWEHNGESATFSVLHHRWSLFGFGYHVQIGSEAEQYRPRFTWPLNCIPGNVAVEQTSEVSIPPGTAGPEVVEWTTTDPFHPKIRWTRLSTTGRHLGLLAPRRGQLPVYRRVETTTRAVAEYHGDSIWGNTFCQALCVGLASYHFTAAENETATNKAYISYEHIRTSMWPSLDDGSPIPSHAPFRDVSWDQNSKEFRGDICWLEDFGTTWSGAQKWSYVMKFDDDLTFIKSGTIHTEYLDQSRLEPAQLFGRDLVYVNAALKVYLEGLAQDRWPNLSRQWNQEAPEGARDMMMAVMEGRSSVDMNTNS